MKKAIAKLTVTLIVLFAAMVVFLSSVYTVKVNETAIIVRFGKISNIEANPGLHFHVPFIENVTSVYTGDILYDIPVSDVITSDKKSMIADNYLIWSVTDVTKYYQTLGAVQGRADERVEAAVFNATKNTISSMTQDNIISARGDTLTSLITKEANSDISQYGITIKIAEIKALDLPDANKEAVYERMISERNNIAASYTASGESDAKKIRTETDNEIVVSVSEAEAKAEKIISEGEAEYMRILSGAYNTADRADFYTFVRSLDAAKKSLKGDKTLILDSKSPLAQIFNEAE